MFFDLEATGLIQLGVLPDIIQIAAVGPDDDVFNRSHQHDFHFRSMLPFSGSVQLSQSLSVCLLFLSASVLVTVCLLFLSASVSVTLCLSLVLVCICLSAKSLFLSVFASLSVSVLHSLSLWLSVLHHSLSQLLSVRQSVLNLLSLSHGLSFSASLLVSVRVCLMVGPLLRSPSISLWLCV